MHTEYSSLLLMLLFIFLKVRNRECWSRDRTGGPAPVHRKNQAKFPALDSSALVGLEQQECMARSHRVDPCFSSPSSQGSRVRGDPRLHSQLACQRECHATLGRQPLMASYVEYLANICCR